MGFLQFQFLCEFDWNFAEGYLEQATWHSSVHERLKPEAHDIFQDGNILGWRSNHPLFHLQSCCIYEKTTPVIFCLFVGLLGSQVPGVLVPFKSCYVLCIFPFFGEDSNIFIPFQTHLLPDPSHPLPGSTLVSSWAIAHSPLLFQGF